jgi:hypothetical protein
MRSACVGPLSHQRRSEFSYPLTAPSLSDTLFLCCCNDRHPHGGDACSWRRRSPAMDWRRERDRPLGTVCQCRSGRMGTRRQFFGNRLNVRGPMLSLRCMGPYSQDRGTEFSRHNGTCVSSLGRHQLPDRPRRQRQVDERQFDSQETDDWYRSRCAGAIFVTNPTDRSYVATTRKDGAMRIEVDAAGRSRIEHVSVGDWPRKPPMPAPLRKFGALSALLDSCQNLFGSDFLADFSTIWHSR